MAEKIYVAKESTSQEILALLSASGGSEDTVILALLSDDTALNEWAFRQSGIGKVINDIFALGSTALAACNTVAAIAASSTAISAIGASSEAVRICAKNKTLATALMSYMTDEEILAAGLGYKKYSVGQEVTLNWYGNPTTFIVTHKGYLTSGKIVLHSKGLLGGHIWAAGANAALNYYSSSGLRTYLNTTVLAGFSERIQAAITQTAVACHDKATAVTCYDKIWALSYAEAGLGTSDYAPVEGSALSYFTSADKRKKGGWWWLRTPGTNNSNLAWNVDTDGAANYNYTANEYGVVPAFEI